MSASYLDAPLVDPPPGGWRRRRLDAILDRAARCTDLDRMVELCVIGDSTTTLPAGNGRSLVNAIALLLGQHYGNIPALHWMPAGASSTEYLLSRAGAGNVHSAYPAGVLVTAIGATCQVPAGAFESAYQIKSATGGKLGPIFTLQADGHRENNAVLYGLCNILNDGSFSLFPDTGVHLEILGATHPDSCEISCRVLQSDGRVNADYYGTLATTLATTVLTGGTAGQISLARQRLGPLAKGTKKYLNCELLGADVTDATKANFVAARFRNPDPSGIAVTAMSKGGQQSHHWFGSPRGADDAGIRHGAAAAFLGQMPCDIALFLIGANDAFAGKSAAEFLADLWTPGGDGVSAGRLGLVGDVLAAFRSQGRDPYPILVSQWHRRNGGADGTYAAKLAAYNQYAAVLQQVAEEAGGLAINLRRMTESLGCNARRSDYAGLNNRGNWANTTAYALNDMVTSPTYGGRFRCVAGHTSNANEPGNTASVVWQIYWEGPIDTWYAATNDLIHLSELGAYLTAQELVRAILGRDPGGAVTLSTGAFLR